MTGKRSHLVLALALAGALGAVARARADEDARDSTAADRMLERTFIDDVSARPYLQYVRLDVRAQGKALDLLGRAGSELERALLELMARNQPGVGAVRDELVVDGTLPRYSPGPAEARRTRARNVLRRIRSDPGLAVFSTLRTFVEGETVRLRGAVEHPWQHDAALALARQVAGSRVRDELEVVPDASRSAPLPEPDADSSALEGELDGALGSDRLLRDVTLRTVVRDRRVTLVGRAPAALEQDYALEVIRRHLEDRLRGETPAPVGAFERRLVSGTLDPALDRAEVESVPRQSYLLVSRALIGGP